MHIVMCAPFAMAVIRMRLAQMDPKIEAAAWNLRANQWKAMRYVILPFTAPSLFAALFVTMAVSFDEFAVAWFVSGLNERVPVRILNTLQGQVSPTINALWARSLRRVGQCARVDSARRLNACNRERLESQKEASRPASPEC